MINRRKHLSTKPSRRGAIVVFLAVGLSVFLTFSAIAVNVAYMQATRTELRTTVDAATRAAAQKLNAGGTKAEARSIAIQVAGLNKIAGREYKLPGKAVVFGNASRNGDGRFSFTADALPTNAVKVLVERSSATKNGAVSTIMGGLLGVASYDVAQTAISLKADRDISLIIDRSGSMMWRLDKQEVYPDGYDHTMPPSPNNSRWATLIRAYAILQNSLNKTTATERMTLVSYSTDASTDVQWTGKYDSIADSLIRRSQKPIEGWTNLGDAMNLGLDQLLENPKVRYDAIKTMIVLTDGVPNRGPWPVSVAHRAADHNVVVHTVSFGDFADKWMMKEIADITNGSYYDAPTEQKLANAFQKIAEDLPVRLIQ